MKTLYLECHMGAAGDMLMAALLELHDNPADFLRRLNAAGIPNVTVSAEASVKCGIKGTHIRVSVDGQEEGVHSRAEHEHEHHHSHDDHHKHDHGGHSHNSYHGIEELMHRLDISPSVRQNALAVYKRIAEAESHVHGVPVSQIHFHEVGDADAIADIVGVCMLIGELKPDRVLVSPVNVGSGQVRCAHGILPVPAPAAAHLLQNVPIYSDQITGELCTPTGAALLKHFAAAFGAMPPFSVEKIGYGMGTKDFAKANCLRAFLGDEASGAKDEAAELVCNLDDMTPEAVAFAAELLREAGALDVYTTPIGMKKGRAGLSLACLCRPEDKERLLALLFKHTTTLGVRESLHRRYVLQREQTQLETELGTVRVKASRGYGVTGAKPEYEDIARIAREKGVSLEEVLRAVDAAQKSRLP